MYEYITSSIWIFYIWDKKRWGINPHVWFFLCCFDWYFYYICFFITT